MGPENNKISDNKVGLNSSISGLTIMDALELPILNKCKVLAGEEGLDRKIQAVSVMDAPDFIHWLKGGELILTTAYCFVDKPDLFENTIDEMNKRGSVGLGVKLDRYFTQLPISVIQKANELKLPIISIPFDYAWIDIINPVMSEILDQTTKALKRSDLIHKSFINQILGGGNLLSVAQLLSEFVQNPVTIFEYVNYTKHSHLDNIIDRDVASYRETEHQKTHTREILNNMPELFRILSPDLDNATEVLCPIRLDNYIYGHIVISEVNRKVCESDFTPIEHALTTSTLGIQKLKQRYNDDIRYRSGFIRQLISENNVSEQLIDLGEWELNWDTTLNYVVYLADTKFEKDQSLTPKREMQLSYQYKENAFHNTMRELQQKNILAGLDARYCMIFLVPEEFSFLYCETEKRKIPFEMWLYNKLNLLRPYKWIIGVGSTFPGVQGISKGYKQALEAINMAKYIEDDKLYPIKYSNLGALRILGSTHSDKELNTFIEDTVGSIIKYDTIHNNNMLKTIETFLDCNCNYNLAAKKLFLHHNTVRYRVRVAEEVAGISFESPFNRLNMLVAIKLIQLKKSSNSGL